MLAVKRAVLLSTGDRYFGLVCSFASAAIVSRILTPGEIGVSVIASSILVILMSAREFASTSFLIQRQELTREEIRGSFTVLLLMTIAIVGILEASAPILAAAYGETNLSPYFRVVCVCLLVDMFSLHIMSLLRRDMAFGRLAIISISGTATGTATTLVLASLGFSYMSFAWGWLAGSVVTSALALSISPHFWMFKPTLRRLRGMAEFGGYNGAIVILFKAYEALPFLLLGRILSHDAAALFSRSHMICRVPDQLILGGAVSVVLPAFAAQARTGGDMKRPYLNALEMITVLHWPALLVLAVLAQPVVDILLGSQWREVAPLVRIMAVASLFSFSFALNYSVMVAMGSIKEWFYRTLIVVPVSAAVLAAAILLGGIQGLTWSMMFIVPFQAFVALTFVRRRLAMEWAEIAGAVWRSGRCCLGNRARPTGRGRCRRVYLRSFGSPGVYSRHSCRGVLGGRHFDSAPSPPR